MVKIYYYETEDYNGMAAVEEGTAVDLNFPQDGTLEMAKSEDLNGIVGSKTIEDVMRFIGVQIETFPFNENDYERIEYICTL